jgi:hypothetical protein
MMEHVPYGFGAEVAAELEARLRAARVERARAVSAAFAAAFRWLRALSSALPASRAAPGPARC